MRVNKDLIWDYDVQALDFHDTSVERWYVERVLTRGSLSDLCDLGLERIRNHLPHLRLPARVGEFWRWYLEQESQHGDPHPISTGSPARDRT